MIVVVVIEPVVDELLLHGGSCTFRLIVLADKYFLTISMADSFYAPNQVHDWQSKLTGLAQKPRTRFTKKQAVEAMIEEVELALVSHPYEEVAENLKQWGLDITAGTLKQYVNAYRREHGAEKAAPARKRSSQGRRKRLPLLRLRRAGKKRKSYQRAIAFGFW